MSESIEHLTGEWTIHQIGELHPVLLSLVNQKLVSFDASAISEMDSAGVQLLISARNALGMQGLEMQLIAASPCVRDALHCYGLDAHLHPIGAEEAA